MPQAKLKSGPVYEAMNNKVHSPWQTHSPSFGSLDDRHSDLCIPGLRQPCEVESTVYSLGGGGGGGGGGGRGEGL